ncbi:MAG: beta-hexosaminidase [Lachnospiraceae bacterium]|nr:beta-hexosaminidase [Lachnospiraceae bacterium]
MKKYVAMLLLFVLFSLTACKKEKPVEPATQPDFATQEMTQDLTNKPTNPAEPTTKETEADETENAIKELISTMTVEEKVGQMFIVRCPVGTGVKDVTTYKVGGYILFARDFQNETRDSLKANIKSYQAASKIPLLISVDEEGGSVVRASKYSQFRENPFPSPLTNYVNGGFELLAKDATEKSLFLKELGINMNLAPVCDLPDFESDYIYKRTLGTDVNVATTGIKTIVEKMEVAGMISTLKHFPGYGSNVDTHTGIAIDERSYAEFEANDFLPFKAGIEAGAPCVMISHNIVNCMDSTMPASLSPNVNKVLRENLSFDGVIMTDDLAMNAIKLYTGNEQAAVLAVKAGNDLLCVDDYYIQIPAVINAVKNGEISIGQIDKSVERILKMKHKYGILRLKD